MNKRVVIGLCTTPTRINLIEDTILSLINQTLKPDVIYINLPEVCIKENKTYTIPNFFSKYKILKINRIDRDLGPSNKLLPILSIEKDPETLIFTADDDIIYDNKWIEDFLNTLGNRDVIISSTIWSIESFLYKIDKQKKYNIKKLLELNFEKDNFDAAATGAGAMFKVKYFKDFDLNEYYPKYYYYGNDMFFAIITKNIKKIQSNKKYYHHLDYGNHDDALSKSGQNINNYINILHDFFKIDYVNVKLIKNNLLNCPFFKKYKENYKNIIFKEKEYSFVFEKKYDNLMIVAHPDDEIIFGGVDLINEENCLVIVCTNDYSRQNMIDKVSKNLKFDYLILDHIDTQIKNLRFHPRILDILSEIILKQNWKKIITHNSEGEYGHPQHILIHKIVSHLLHNLNCNNLFTFNENNKKKLDDKIIKIKSDNLKIYNRSPERWPQINYFISKKSNTVNYDLKDIICKL